MLPFATLLAAGVLLLGYGGQSLLYQQKSLEAWDPERHRIKWTHGVSYIFDRPPKHISPSEQIIIIYSHASAIDITVKEDVREWCRESGYGLMLYDYYGYGASESCHATLMSQNLLCLSIEEIYHHTRKKYPCARIYLMGESLGTYPSAWLSHSPYAEIDGLILCVPFDRLCSIVGPGVFIVGEFDILEMCKYITVPTLVISAERDHLIPKTCAENIMRCLTECVYKKHISVWSGHSNYFSLRQTRKAVSNFIES